MYMNFSNKINFYKQMFFYDPSYLYFWNEFYSERTETKVKNGNLPYIRIKANI